MNFRIRDNLLRYWIQIFFQMFIRRLIDQHQIIDNTVILDIMSRINMIYIVQVIVKQSCQIYFFSCIHIPSHLHIIQIQLFTSQFSTTVSRRNLFFPVMNFRILYIFISFQQLISSGCFSSPFSFFFIISCHLNKNPPWCTSHHLFNLTHHQNGLPYHTFYR